MQIETFGYRGHFVFTPPLTAQNSSRSLMVLATPFGNSTHLEEALQEFTQVFESLEADPDATNPYPKLTCFDHNENLLYTGLQFLNDKLYSEHNHSRISLGCDLVCILKSDHSIYLTQVGWPLILKRSPYSSIPIHSENAYKASDPENTPFLTPQLLGLETSINLRIQQIKLSPDENITLVKSNAPFQELFTAPNLSLRELTELHAKHNPSQGFWGGQFSFR